MCNTNSVTSPFSNILRNYSCPVQYCICIKKSFFKNWEARFIINVMISKVSYTCTSCFQDFDSSIQTKLEVDWLTFACEVAMHCHELQWTIAVRKIAILVWMTANFIACIRGFDAHLCRVCCADCFLWKKRWLALETGSIAYITVAF